MTRHLSNSAWSVLDYAAYPAIMLLATPTMLHHLGIASYGIWLIANAAVSAGTLVSSGFGDAIIQRVAALRSIGDHRAIQRAIANVLAINLLLSIMLAVLLLTLLPYATTRIAPNDPALQSACLWSLQIGTFLIALKSVESVFISAQRAFEHYPPAVRISIATRVATILLALIMASRGYGVPALMVVTLLAVSAGTLAQALALRKLGVTRLTPAIDRTVCRDLLSFGTFSWLQALAGVFFSQADRLLLAFTLGASAVAYYGVCVQIAQPIHGLTAAALHFLFPHLARRSASHNISAIRRPIILAMSINVLCATSLAALLILFGKPLPLHWMGHDFADQSATLLPLLAIGFAALSFNVTAHYALLALGRVRIVTALNIAGGLAMLILMAALVPHRGVEGAAFARLIYGPITCLLYLPLFRSLRNKRHRSIHLVTIAPEEA